MIEVETVCVGALGTNAYLLCDKATGKRAVVDPGAADPRFISEIRGYAEDYELILLTHRHADHLLGLPAVKRLTGAAVCISAEDACGAMSAEDSLCRLIFPDYPFEPVPADRLLCGGDTVSLGESRLRVFSAPGHTVGGLCFLEEEGHLLFSGDTLMRDYHGRTDFPTGSTEALITSVRALFALPGDWTVYPGHGEATTLERERKHNQILWCF